MNAMIKFFRSRQKTHTWQIGFHYRYTPFFPCPVSSPVFFSRKQKCKKTHTSFIENGVCESLLTKIQHLKEIVTKNKFFFRQHKYLMRHESSKTNKEKKYVDDHNGDDDETGTNEWTNVSVEGAKNKTENRKQIIELNEMTLTLCKEW